MVALIIGAQAAICFCVFSVICMIFHGQFLRRRHIGRNMACFLLPNPCKQGQQEYPQMQPQPYPVNIKPLTSLRFMAAIWVVCFHFADRLQGAPDALYALFSHGDLAVDFFFMLSGFILAHVYLQKAVRGRLNYADFIKNRLARIYPLHVATLAATIALLAMISALGLGQAENNLADYGDIPAHLLLIHAWGVLDANSFNYPSWSISAEWFAYLSFPLFMTLAFLMRRRPALMLLASLALLALIARASPVLLGESYTRLTWNFGILRIIPEFAAGVALYMLGRRHALSANMAMTGFSLALAAVIAIAILDLPPIATIPFFAIIIVTSAEFSRSRSRNAPVRRLLENRKLIYLGEISYSVYLVHALVYTIWFKGVERLLGESLAAQWQGLIWLASFPLVVLAAMAGYHLIEVPGRRFIKGLEIPRRPLRKLANGAEK
jgi:peptidoglycan/LPS O-acetylase OafA/YrhL